MNTSSDIKTQNAVAEQTAEAAPDSMPQPIPGSELIGCGIYLRPRQPYELKRCLLVKKTPSKGYYSRDTDSQYLLPEDVDVNSSPPMPAHQAVNRLIIEDSRERLEKASRFDANVASSNMPFSVSLNASQATQQGSHDDAYYALRNSFVPLFTLAVPDASMLLLEQEDIDRIPDVFDHDCRFDYLRFFEKYGTHYVKRVWVGGSATLAFTILKSSRMTKKDIQMGIKASLGFGGGGADRTLNDVQETLKENSDCTVSGKGGNALLLAKLSSLEENSSYDAWLQSVIANPEAIELEVAGIWTLVDGLEQEREGRPELTPASTKDVQARGVSTSTGSIKSDRAKALLNAYKAETTFAQLSAVFEVGGFVLFIQGQYFIKYCIAARKADKPRPIAKVFPKLAAIGFDGIDATFSRVLAESREGGIVTTEITLFRHQSSLTLHVQHERSIFDPDNSPKTPRDFDKLFKKITEILEKSQVQSQQPICNLLPDIEFDRIDAAFCVGPGRLALFRKGQYVRYDLSVDNDNGTSLWKKVPGYPQPISKRWEGVNFERIDAALYWGNEKVYFFREDQYIRYDLASFRADPGYPKYIPSGYVEDWEFFE